MDARNITILSNFRRCHIIPYDGKLVCAVRILDRYYRCYKCLWGWDTYEIPKPFPYEFRQPRPVTTTPPSRTTISTTIRPTPPSTTTPSPDLYNTITNIFASHSAYYFLIPLVAILILTSIVLGIMLIVKSYRMGPLKQNLARAIRRNRQFGHAPQNHYVPPSEVRASQTWLTEAARALQGSRKSYPPESVLRAARERAMRESMRV